jgi:hypothetical protein
MVGVYTDLDRVAEVNEEGRTFTLGEMPPGRYLVLIFSRGDLREKREVDVLPFLPAVLEIE